MMYRPVRIEQVSLESKDLAFELLVRFFNEEGFTTPPEQIRANLSQTLLTDDNPVFIAWQDEKPVGVATLSTSLGIELGFIAELENLYVLPEERHKGIGRALIEASQAWCRQRNYAGLYVVVTPEGHEAHNLLAFYRTQGFQETGRTFVYFSMK